MRGEWSADGEYIRFELYLRAGLASESYRFDAGMGRRLALRMYADRNEAGIVLAALTTLHALLLFALSTHGMHIHFHNRRSSYHQRHAAVDRLCGRRKVPKVLSRASSVSPGVHRVQVAVDALGFGKLSRVPRFLRLRIASVSLNFRVDSPP